MAKDFPNNTALNTIFPNRPVILKRIDGHAILVNDEALKRAGINANTKIQPYSITSALLANNLTYASDLTITGNLSITGDLAVNGGDITTSATTFNLVNATATTVNNFIILSPFGLVKHTLLYYNYNIIINICQLHAILSLA